MVTTATLVGVAVLVAALDLAATALGWEAIRPYTQPLPAIALCLAAGVSSERTRTLSFGLLLAAFGDRMLLNPGERAFLAGMVLFAAMHLCYIVAYRRTGLAARSDRSTRLVAAAYGAAYIGANAALDPHAGSFAIPLAIYSALLATMAWSAFDLHNRVRAGAPAVALGGALFMLSDTIIAFAKFYPGFPLAGRNADLAVLVTYFAAQVLIAAGMLRASAAISS